MHCTLLPSLQLLLRDWAVLSMARLLPVSGLVPRSTASLSVQPRLVPPAAVQQAAPPLSALSLFLVSSPSSLLLERPSAVTETAWTALRRSKPLRRLLSELRSIEYRSANVDSASFTAYFRATGPIAAHESVEPWPALFPYLRCAFLDLSSSGCAKATTDEEEQRARRHRRRALRCLAASCAQLTTLLLTIAEDELLRAPHCLAPLSLLPCLHTFRLLGGAYLSTACFRSLLAMPVACLDLQRSKYEHDYDDGSRDSSLSVADSITSLRFP